MIGQNTKSAAIIFAIMAFALVASFAHAADKMPAAEPQQNITVTQETQVEKMPDGQQVTTHTEVRETVGTRQEIRQDGEKIEADDVKFTGRGNNHIQRSANNWTDEGWTNDLGTKDVVNIKNTHLETKVVKETMYGNLNN